MCPHEWEAEGPRCQGGHGRLPARLPAFPSLPWRESLTRATGRRKRQLSWEARARPLAWFSLASRLPRPRCPSGGRQRSRPGSRGALPPQGRGRPLAGAAADLRGCRPAFLAFRPRPRDSWEKPADLAASAQPRAACSRERLRGGRPKPVPRPASPLAWSHGRLTKSIRAARGCALRRQPS